MHMRSRPRDLTLSKQMVPLRRAIIAGFYLVFDSGSQSDHQADLLDPSDVSTVSGGILQLTLCVVYGDVGNCWATFLGYEEATRQIRGHGLQTHYTTANSAGARARAAVARARVHTPLAALTSPARAHPFCGAARRCHRASTARRRVAQRGARPRRCRTCATAPTRTCEIINAGWGVPTRRGQADPAPRS